MSLTVPSASVDLSKYMTADSVSQQINQLQSAIPVASNSVPPAALASSSIGTSTQFARADHTHDVKVLRAIVTTGSDGTAVWNFVKNFSQPPIMSYMVQDVITPCIVQISSVTVSSVTVKLYRSQMLPSSLTLLSSLVSYNIFGATNNIAGINIHLFAAERTQ